MKISRKMEIFYDYVNLKASTLNLADKALDEIKKAKKPKCSVISCLWGKT